MSRTTKLKPYERDLFSPARFEAFRRLWMQTYFDSETIRQKLNARPDEPRIPPGFQFNRLASLGGWSIRRPADYMAIALQAVAAQKSGVDPTAMLLSAQRKLAIARSLNPDALKRGKTKRVAKPLPPAYSQNPGRFAPGLTMGRPPRLKIRKALIGPATKRRSRRAKTGSPAAAE